MKVLKFGAVWCNGCLVMRPRWGEIEKENPWLMTEYYDFDIDQKMVAKYDVDSGVLPTFIFLDKTEKELKRMSGEVEKSELLKAIAELKDK